MRAVVQRVKRASVTVDGRMVGAIDAGLLVYLGIGAGDDAAALAYMVDKVTGLRIFADDAGRMNRSVREARGAVMIVSQFTLYGDVRSGRRPGFDAAMEPGAAETMYLRFCDAVRASGLAVATGVFRADMQIECVVDGPVTILVDSAKTF